jgi:nucleoside-diphosphate-sugar epimerase
VTGATGFLGSYLTRLLVREGETVAILCRPGGDSWRIKNILPYVTYIEGDLLDLDPVRERILEFAPDTVFHLAWYGVGNKHRNDREQVRLNLMSSLALLELAAEAGCRSFIGFGSQAEYGPQNMIIDEAARTDPSTLYGAVKLSTYLLGRQIAAELGVRFAWLRLFSSYGPMDGPDWMIPYLIRALLRGEEPALTPGEQRWDYLFVEDVAAAAYAVAKSPEAEGVFNLGSGTAHTLRKIIERIRDAIDPSLPLGLGKVPYRPDQVMHLQADPSKLKTVTGWEPQTGLDEGLERTVEWHRRT